MTEEEARGLAATIVDAAAMDRLATLAALVRAENERQNLVAASTIPAIWMRHLLDSVQLLRYGRPSGDPWLDIGTGGGFPGLALACALPDDAFVLVEPRRRRAMFLRDAAATLELANVEVAQAAVETLALSASVISARAVASVENLLRGAARCATPGTRWLLPRGRNAGEEIATLTRRWRGTFHVEHSLTDPDAVILIAEGVAAR